MVQSLSTSERNLLYQNYDAFAAKHPEYTHLMPVRESIYKLNRLEGLQLSIQQNMLELGAIEQKEFDKLLHSTYENGYLSAMKGLDNRESFFGVDNNAMKQTLSRRWTNKQNYSDRIWENKNRLINTMNTEIRDGFIRGDSYAKMSKAIRNRTNVGANDALRLIATEDGFIANQSNMQAFMDDGIERYRITAVMDKRTSPTCRHMDGQSFLFKDAKVGINFPPFHPWCRSTIVPIENNVLKLDLQRFAKKADKDLLNRKIKDGSVDVEQFKEAYRYFKTKFKDGIKTPVSVVRDGQDSFYHIAQRHPDMISVAKVDRIIGTLENPKSVYRTSDRFGNEATCFIEDVRTNQLIAIVRGDIITAYEPSEKYIEKITRGGELLWER